MMSPRSAASQSASNGLLRLHGSGAGNGAGALRLRGSGAGSNAGALRLRGSGAGSGAGALDVLVEMENLVRDRGAYSLPGCTIKYESFLPALRRAVSRGYVKDWHAAFVERGLVEGFTLGVDPDSLKGQRIFSNGRRAYMARAAVSESIWQRVQKHKTLHLGPWNEVYPLLVKKYRNFFCFPLNAVPKPHQPEVMRPTSDHTRTGFNAATVMGILRYSLDTYNRVAWLLKRNAFMYVSDVEDAFLIIPLSPVIWPFMIFRWFASSEAVTENAFMHLFGDFGTRGLPGTFKIFLVDVVVQVARSEFVVTLPLEVYVDDVAMIGAEGGGDAEAVNAEMRGFQEWSVRVTGVTWKVLKDKEAAVPQYYVGFWWDSRVFSRTLDEQKLLSYLNVLASAGVSRCLNLQERQSLAGKMQRAIMTFPPGAACLLVNCYRLMAGLTLSWHKRRTTRSERADYRFVHDLLRLNLGKGYYSYEGFGVGPEYRSDASKSRDHTGGGWCGADGCWDYFVYGTSASRKLIDYLEGDVVVRCCRARGHSWRDLQIPFGIDNQAFERSAERGRSRAPRLNEQLRELFVLQIHHGFILCPYWISTADNYLADHLSRGRPLKFIMSVPGSGFLVVPFSELRSEPDPGRTVVLSSDECPGMAALRQLLSTYSSNSEKDGPSARGMSTQTLSVSYPMASIWDGLPPEFEGRVEQIMDNHLAPGSRDKMMSGFSRWSAFCAERAWSPLLATGMSSRGGRLVAWITSMVDDTSLVYASISTYVWGVRAWNVLQHQADPVYGLMFWREFMLGVAVLTAVPGEARERFPLAELAAILAALDDSSLEDCNFALIALTLLLTFSRTECPCPKAWTGRGTFDLSRHWSVGDFRLLRGPNDRWVLWVRFKAIKQDSRLERPSASHAPEWLPFDAPRDDFGRDWVPVGDVDDPLFSVSRWYMAFVRAVGRERAPDEPMFVARDGVRAYTYGCLISDLRAWQDRLGLPRRGPHGLRVEGYNLSKAAHGVDLTVAHGGWMSEGHSRYERFSYVQACDIPSGMLGGGSLYSPPGGVRPVARGRLRRGDARDPGNAQDLLVAGDAADESSAAGASRAGSAPLASLLPEGFSVEHRTSASGRPYCVYRSPSGAPFYSRRSAWASVASSSFGVGADDDIAAAADDGAGGASGSGSAVDLLDAGADDDVAAAADDGAGGASGSGSAVDLLDAGGASGSGSVVGDGLGAVDLQDASRARVSLRSPSARARGRRRDSAVVEVLSATRCGDPLCIVPSVNGRHAGDCRFPPPPPRR